MVLTCLRQKRKLGNQNVRFVQRQTLKDYMIRQMLSWKMVEKILVNAILMESHLFTLQKTVIYDKSNKQFKINFILLER